MTASTTQQMPSSSNQQPSHRMEVATNIVNTMEAVFLSGVMAASSLPGCYTVSRGEG